MIDKVKGYSDNDINKFNTRVKDSLQDVSSRSSWLLPRRQPKLQRLLEAAMLLPALSYSCFGDAWLFIISVLAIQILWLRVVGGLKSSNIGILYAYCSYFKDPIQVSPSLSFELISELI